jgi:hypothetical protein
MNKFKKDYNEYNALMRRLNSKEKTFDEYVRYRMGKMKKSKSKINKIPTYIISDHREKYPSGIGIGVSQTAKKSNVYTGDLVKGIAIMHKSNSVPVINEEQVIDISKMRRN